MKRKRRKHSAEFKARIALEAIKGIRTVSGIASEYEIYPVMVGKWKNEMPERIPGIFETTAVKRDKELEKEKEGLHRKVGQLTMEVDFLEKKCKQLGIPVKGRNS